MRSWDIIKSVKSTGGRGFFFIRKEYIRIHSVSPVADLSQLLPDDIRYTGKRDCALLNDIKGPAPYGSRPLMSAVKGGLFIWLVFNCYIDR
jgi:hypothetical protein